MRISFISKVTRVQKALKVANNTNLCSTILVVFLEFIPVDRAEHTTEFVLLTEPARLPGSYEEALRSNCHKNIQVYELFVNVIQEMLIIETVVLIDSIQLFSQLYCSQELIYCCWICY